MRVLMIAPQPIFSPRGTPISILNRCRALTALGHEVDLITYPMGDDVAVPGLRYLRAPRIPGINRVKIGPSLAKLPLDVAVFGRTVVQLLGNRYDVIHTNEEAGAFGWWLHRLARARHVYEMHSDLAVVLVNFGFSERHPLTRFAGWLERRVMRSADVVVVHFPDSVARVEEMAPGRPAQLISDIAIEPEPDGDLVERLRAEHAPHGEPLVVYTGTLEPYQGMGLLIDAMVKVGSQDGKPLPRLVVVGGRPDQIAELRRQADGLGLGKRVDFTGLRQPEDIPSYLAVADVIVSPRNRGNNAPLKLLSYLKSGTPMVVTDIVSHTQIVDENVAVITPPDAAGLATGIDLVLRDTVMGRRIGAAARRRAERRYSLEAFVAATAAAYSHVTDSVVGGDALAEAVLRLEQGIASDV